MAATAPQGPVLPVAPAAKQYYYYCYYRITGPYELSTSSSTIMASLHPWDALLHIRHSCVGFPTASEHDSVENQSLALCVDCQCLSGVCSTHSCQLHTDVTAGCSAFCLKVRWGLKPGTCTSSLSPLTPLTDSLDITSHAAPLDEAWQHLPGPSAPTAP